MPFPPSPPNRPAILKCSFPIIVGKQVPTKFLVINLMSCRLTLHVAPSLAIKCSECRIQPLFLFAFFVFVLTKLATTPSFSHNLPMVSMLQRCIEQPRQNCTSFSPLFICCPQNTNAAKLLSLAGADDGSTSWRSRNRPDSSRPWCFSFRTGNESPP